MNFWQSLKKTKILAILRGDFTKTEKILEALWQAGIRIAEVTTNSPQAFVHFNSLSQKFKNKLILGMGTVYNLDLCKKAFKVGAKFIVMPNVEPDVIGFCQKNKIPVVPGVATPTEIARALNLGLKTVKLFPAGFFGPKYLKLLKGPFDQVNFVPVGGINFENAQSFFEAGAFALGVGSDLLDKKALETKNWAKLRKKAEKFMKIAK